MELFAKLVGSLLFFVYHCFDRIVIQGYLSGLSRPDHVVHFFRQVLGIPVVSKGSSANARMTTRAGSKRLLATTTSRSNGQRKAFARKITCCDPAPLGKNDSYGVHFIFKSMKLGRTFRISVPKYPTQDPNHRIHRTGAEPEADRFPQERQRVSRRR